MPVILPLPSTLPPVISSISLLLNIVKIITYEIPLSRDGIREEGISNLLNNTKMTQNYLKNTEIFLRGGDI
jgi:hypothetical protein